MRVLLAHSFYRSENPSGENRVFEEEKSLLERAGVEVRSFIRRSDDMLAFGPAAPLLAAALTPWNPLAARAIRREVERFRPDVVHVHNTFPWLSPSIFHAIGKRAARVLSLHNYRLFCAAAIPARRGQVCTECIDRRSSWPSLRHRCYRDSRIATLPLAVSVSLHRRLGTWTDEVDAFIALTEFQRDLMIEAGLPARKVQVKPNFIAGDPQVVPWDRRGDYAVFVGRLSREKGASTLLNAWKAWGNGAPELRIVGEGPLRHELEAHAAGLPVRFLGALDNRETRAQIGRARLLVVPSEWFEGFALVLAEAFAQGTPVAVSDIGPLPSIARAGEQGVVFASHDPSALLRAVQAAWETPGLLERLGRGARAAFERLYNETSNTQTLMRIYEQAMATSRGG